MAKNNDVVYLSLKKARKAIVLAIMAQKYLPVYESGVRESFGAFLWGESGIGKNGITNDLGIEMTEATKSLWIQYAVNVCGMAPEDVQGIPVVREDKKAQEEILKYFSSMKFKGTEQGIFVLDEFDRPQWAQTVTEMIKFAVDRTDHRAVLPAKMFVLAMGNGVSDINTIRLSDHIKGRFCHIYVSENVEGAADEHIAYMRNKGFNESIIRMFQADPIKTRDEFQQSAIRHKRSGSFANAIVSAYKDMKAKGIDFSDVLLAVLAGVIGKKHAVEVIRYEELGHLPSLKDVCDAPKKAMMPEDMSLCHQYLTVLVSDVRTQCALAPKLLEYIMRYPAEMARFAIENMVRDCPEVVKCPQYVTWVNR